MEADKALTPVLFHGWAGFAILGLFQVAFWSLPIWKSTIKLVSLEPVWLKFRNRQLHLTKEPQKYPFTT